MKNREGGEDPFQKDLFNFWTKVFKVSFLTFSYLTFGYPKNAEKNERKRILIICRVL